MNQTKKRLSIIKIAISITDIETIQLQVLKLGLLRTDEKIQEIIQMLQSDNYAQAQGLITAYIEMPTEEILQRSAQKEKEVLTQDEQSTIDEFQLFITPSDNSENKQVDINDYVSDDLKIPSVKRSKKEEKAVPQEEILEIDINDFPSLSPLPSHKSTKIKPVTEDVFDSLLNMDANDVLKDNITLDISHTDNDNFFDTIDPSSKTVLDTSGMPKDTFFDLEEDISSEEVFEEEKKPKKDFLKKDFLEETLPKEDILAAVSDPFDTLQPLPTEENQIITPETAINTAEIEDSSVDIPEEAIENNTEDLTVAKSEVTSYKSIPYITQKLESMHKQYPSLHSDSESFPSFSKLLTKISQETITEEEIEETLAEVRRLTETESYAQATQLLLVSAATPSPFAKLILARELYKGILLTQNIPQAFILLNELAMDDYPEALCDLGQFYENGIGSKKDKKRAQELYEHAMNLGIKRATNHFNRLKQSKKGFFSK